MTKIEKLLNELSIAFPRATFYDDETAIRTSAEEGYTASGELLFDYYTMDSAEKTYTMGVHKEIEKVLDKYGAYAEFVDAGTVKIYL